MENAAVYDHKYRSAARRGENLAVAAVVIFDVRSQVFSAIYQNFTMSNLLL